MEILNVSREDLDKKDKYLLVASPEIKKMKELAGKSVELIDWILYTTMDRETGEAYKVLSIRTVDGSYATNSPTMIESFEQIIACFGSDFKVINIFTGKSNKGREFLLCSHNS